MHGAVTAAEVAELVRRTGEAASALINGDVGRYVGLVRHADDYTLMHPGGGSRYGASTARTSRWMRRRATSKAGRRSWTWCSPMRPATSSCSC